MGLDWCLMTKPRPGLEDTFLRLTAPEYVLTDAEQEILAAASVTPQETLGCPRVGYDEIADRHMVEVIIPSHRENIAQGGSWKSDTYTAHWTQPDEAILEKSKGAFLPELVDYSLSTVQTAIPFLSLAGAFSFRGKVIGYSPLLTDDLQNEAYIDMDPPEMADYAYRIERCALDQFAAVDGFYMNAHAAREWAENATKCVTCDTNPDPWSVPPHEHDHPQAERAYDLLTVLDAARWLRFWADLGHPMHAWY